MSKILIISDTHQNHKLLDRVLSSNKDCDFLIHLGDEPDDLEYHPEHTANMQIFSVYGLYHRNWSPKTAVLCFSIDGVDFMITHAMDYLNETKKNCIHCFGHTHHRYFSQEENKVFLNPGHLKKETDRNEIAGYAVLDFANGKTITYYDYSGNPLFSHKIKAW